MLIIVRERFVVVVDLRQMRVSEDLRQDRQPAALLRRDLPALLALPATPPARLILPVLGITDARLRLDIVEPRVFHALARGPHILAGHRTSVAADTLVEIQYHRDLRPDFHATVSLVARSTGFEWSSQSILLSFRTMTNS